MTCWGSYQTEEVGLAYIVDLDMTALLQHEHEVYDMAFLQNMVQSRGLGRRLGRNWDGSASATRIGLGRYAQNAT